MTNRREKESGVAAPVVPWAVDLELILGLGSEDAELVLDPEMRSADLHPWLLDCVAVKVECLGHQDEFPRSWDWENVLTLLEPGEELLYVLDHVRGDGIQAGRAFTLWLAVRFAQRHELSAADLDRRRKRARMLVSQFQRQAFPGSDVRWVEPSVLPTLLGFSSGGEPRCICVSGLPSPRDLEDDRRGLERASATRNYQSLNDVAESLVDLRCDYRIAFVVERVDADSLRVRLGQVSELRDAIHPHVRATVQLGGSEGTNTTNSSSEADGSSTSDGATEGNQTGSSVGGGVGVNLGPAVIGVQATYNDSKNSSVTTTIGKTWTRTKGAATGASEAKNWNLTQERIRSRLELADRSLERTVAALHEAHGTGGYRWSALILADGQDADLIGGALVGVLAGSRTKDYPFNRFPVRGGASNLLFGNESLLSLVQEAAPIVPLSRACEALLLPEAELPGVRLRRNVFLGRTSSPPDGGQPRVALGPDAFSALTADESAGLIEIPRRDIFRHILVAGTTGSGKTTRVVEILNRLEDEKLSVVVFETAKRTYRRRLQRGGRPAPVVYALGSSHDRREGRYRPLRLNPFFFELGTSLKRHIAVLSDALAELMPTEAMIAPLMRRAVEAAYVERGWDIESGLPSGERSASWPSVLDFAAHVRQVAQTLNYGPEVTANYRGALESRAALFLDATFQDIFAHGGNVPIDELFAVGHDAIIEVEELPPSEIDIRAFVMTLLLNRLRAVQSARGSQSVSSPVRNHPLHVAAGTRRWLVVVEEAHNVLDRSFEVRRPADESNAGRSLLRCIDRLLQEGREMELGVMVIDQSPTSLARSVISNTGTKIVMRLEDGDEMAEIGRAMGLEEASWKKLGYLHEGEAIIKASFMDSPVKTSRFETPAEPPHRDEAIVAGSVPRYAELSELWSEAFRGSRALNEAWLAEMHTAADERVDLAAFVGVKQLLEYCRNDADVLAKTKELRAVLAGLHPRATDVLAAACATLNRIGVAASYGPLVDVARVMFRALVKPAAADSTIRMTGVGIRRAGECLELAGVGEAKTWRALLLALSSSRRSGWSDACDRFAAYCSEAGRSDVTVPFRLVLLAADAARNGNERALDAVELVLRSQAMQDSLLELDARAEDPMVMERWKILAEHCTREVALDLASRHGEGVRASVASLLNLEVASDA